MKIRYLREARDELADALLWYEEQQPMLGSDFLGEISRAEVLLRENPQVGMLWPKAPKLRELRRCVLPRFPYCLAYEIRGDDIVILAVAHARRKPMYWIERNDG